jgi:hypothetical protein
MVAKAPIMVSKMIENTTPMEVPIVCLPLMLIWGAACAKKSNLSRLSSYVLVFVYFNSVSLGSS